MRSRSTSTPITTECGTASIGRAAAADRSARSGPPRAPAPGRSSNPLRCIAGHLRPVLRRLGTLAFAALFVTSALAQYPTRPIKLVVPIPPGGAPDISARVVGQRLAEVIG